MESETLLVCSVLALAAAAPMVFAADGIVRKTNHCSMTVPSDWVVKPGDPYAHSPAEPKAGPKNLGASSARIDEFDPKVNLDMASQSILMGVQMSKGPPPDRSENAQRVIYKIGSTQGNPIWYALSKTQPVCHATVRFERGDAAQEAVAQKIVDSLRKNTTGG
ncbi:MAG TPA: hypothetical protein VHE81_00840 [Lacipirellulaceae bacterium]|nr:hypothetical protein [Lacipirellulaceae bacterium]